MIMLLFFIIFLAVILFLVRNIRVVEQSKAFVIESLGAYKTTWHVGLHIKIPFIERVSRRVSLKEQMIDFAPTTVITKDNVSVLVDSVIFFQITDPKLYTYGVENPIEAINQLTNTTMRNIFGEMEFDQALTSRENINTKVTAELDKATDPWGIKVNRVELKQITPPKDIQESMERQMKAERERREMILKAEGEKKSSILVAEGKKQSVILDAEADKESAILHAEAEAQRKIKEATAEAEAIILVKEAQARAFGLLDKQDMKQATVQIRALEALEKLADGNATKLIIPSELQNLGGILGAANEMVK